MAFSFTVNNRTYTEGDFVKENYAVNFLQFISDCTEHISGRFRSKGSTVGYSASPTTIIPELHKAFYFGMPVTLFCPGYNSIYMCTVTFYDPNGPYMTLTVDKILGDSVPTERSDWVICIGGYNVEQASGPYVGVNCVTSSTVSGIKDMVGLPYPGKSLEPHFEDFCGYLPELESLSSSTETEHTMIPGLAVVMAGQSTVSFDGNQKEMFADSRCPGVVVLSCKTPGDSIVMFAKGSDTYADEFKALFRVFIPEAVPGNRFQLAVGIGSLAFRNLELSTGSFLAYDNLRGTDSESKPIEFQTNWDDSGDTGSVVANIDDVWPEGRWINICLHRPSDDYTVAYVYTDPGEFVPITPYQLTLAYGSGTTPQECFPFILLKKLSGNKPSVVYADYIGSRCLSTR